MRRIRNNAHNCTPATPSPTPARQPGQIGGHCRWLDGPGSLGLHRYSGRVVAGRLAQPSLACTDSPRLLPCQHPARQLPSSILLGRWPQPLTRTRQPGSSSSATKGWAQPPQRTGASSSTDRATRIRRPQAQEQARALRGPAWPAGLTCSARRHIGLRTAPLRAGGGTRTPDLLFTRQQRIVFGVLARAVLAAQVGWVVQPVRS